MPYREDIGDILAYAEKSRATGSGEPITIGDILASPSNTSRWPRVNTAPRAPIAPVKLAIIHERDGGRCRYCGVTDVMLTVDHIIPRSAFLPEDLPVADRSDNLISACWDCNAEKSNFEDGMLKRPGVVVRCWDCESSAIGTCPDPVLVFCGRCGMGAAAPLGWVL